LVNSPCRRRDGIIPHPERVSAVRYSCHAQYVIIVDLDRCRVSSPHCHPRQLPGECPGACGISGKGYLFLIRGCIRQEVCGVGCIRVHRNVPCGGRRRGISPEPERVSGRADGVYLHSPFVHGDRAVVL
jgi:hypothetical protein